MKDGEEERKTGDGKGFAGLSSLVSNVDMAPAPAEKAESIAAETISETPSQQSAQAQPSLQHQGYQEHAQSPSTGSSVGKWVLGIASIIGVLWLIGLADKSSTSHPPTYAQPKDTAKDTPKAEQKNDSKDGPKLEAPKGKELVHGFGIVLSLEILNAPIIQQQQITDQFISTEEISNGYTRNQNFLIDLIKPNDAESIIIGDSNRRFNRIRSSDLLQQDERHSRRYGKDRLKSYQ